MSAFRTIFCPVSWAYLLIVFGAILISWFPIEPGSGLERVHRALHGLTEPVLGPVRRLLPPVRIGMSAIDLSPIVVLLGIRLLQVIVGC